MRLTGGSDGALRPRAASTEITGRESCRGIPARAAAPQPRCQEACLCASQPPNAKRVQALICGCDSSVDLYQRTPRSVNNLLMTRRFYGTVREFHKTINVSSNLEVYLCLSKNGLIFILQKNFLNLSYIYVSALHFSWSLNRKTSGSFRSRTAVCLLIRFSSGSV